MKHQEVKNNSYRKKMVFNALLSNELSNCKYKVDASYEWRNTNQILSLRFSEKQVIQLSVNLNIGAERIFRNSDKAAELCLRYRAYYISNYIHCLEAATTINPQSYFSGLVTLCAINNICNKGEITSFSPIMDKRPRMLKPIDVHCAIRALTRLIIDCNAIISPDTKRECDVVINNLLTYSLLPEIGYKRTRPVYSLLCEIKELQQNTTVGKNPMSIFPLFEENNINNFEELTLDDLIIVCNQIQNPFWTGVIMRLLSFTEEKLRVGIGQDTHLRDCIYQYEDDSVKYFVDIKKVNDTLLTDNYVAVRRLARRFNKVFTVVSAGSGALHYYQ